jgi:Acetyltransferase (GNAT) domain
MKNTISIKQLTREQWDELSPKFRDLSYRQCGAYADAAASEVGGMSEFIAIFQASELIGLANVRVKMVPFSNFGIAYSNYGPLTTRSDEFSAELFGYCLDALKQTYVESRGLMLRIIPPLRGGRWLEAQADCLRSRGFRSSIRDKPHETFILDLTTSLSDIRKNFDGKWRGHLSKAERSNIEVTKSVELVDFDRLEPMFINLVQSKGFTTRQDVAFFRRVQQKARADQRLVVHLAWHAGELIAGHIGSFVGDTAVYLIGAASSKGRELRGSYLLQWAVIEHAKSVGNLFYDLGGIDQRMNPNVYTFKKGLSGRHVAELGCYEVQPGALTTHVLNLLENAFIYLRNLRQWRRA